MILKEIPRKYILMNNISLVGRLTKDPELAQTQNGIPVCSFTLAVRRPHTKDVTDFININAWRQSAEYISSYARKGNLVSVNGYLTERKWQDRNGNSRISFEVMADALEICESRPSDGVNGNNRDGILMPPSNRLEYMEEDEGLPF